MKTNDQPSAVQQITALDCIDLRAKVLRPNQPKELCRYPEDTAPSTLHLGIYIHQHLVCTGTFIQKICPLFSDISTAYQLRGMATDLHFQGQGLGRSLLLSAEKNLQQKNCELIWFNARKSAFGFYQKCGYTLCGEFFEIPLVGPHKIMFKKISLI